MSLGFVYSSGMSAGQCSTISIIGPMHVWGSGTAGGCVWGGAGPTEITVVYLYMCPVSTSYR